MNKPRDEVIRYRAYEIWLSLGQPDGCADEHWLMAERELAENESAMSRAYAARAAIDAAEDSAATSVSPDADIAAVLPDSWAETRLEAQQFR